MHKTYLVKNSVTFFVAALYNVLEKNNRLA